MSNTDDGDIAFRIFLVISVLTSLSNCILCSVCPMYFRWSVFSYCLYLLLSFLYTMYFIA
jgi:hypothetical protein